MNFFLKILNETRGRQVLKADGYSGMRYIFKWDGKLRAYTYQPKEQDEVDDLFKTMGRTTAYLFCPVNKTVVSDPELDALKAAGEEASPILPTTTSTGEPPVAVLDEKLTEQCLQRGLIVTDDDTNEMADRLIHAYDKGASAALESIKQPKRGKPAKTKPEAALAPV